MKTTMKDVARMARVSPTTVSHVINGTRNVSKATRRRVVEAIQASAYQVNPIARNLRSGSSNVIGLVASNLSNYFYMEVGRGLNLVLASAGYDVVYIDSHESRAIEQRNIEKFLRYSVAGLIVVPTQNDGSFLKDLVPSDFPMVFVDRRPSGFCRDSILATNERGSYDAVRLLQGKGHRQIAFVSSRDNSTTVERLEGYLRAHREYAIEPDERNIHMGVGHPVTLQELKEGQVFRLTGKLLAEGRVTAIFSANNLATVGVYNRLREEGVPIPERIALVSFDDSFWFSMATPAITAVAQSPEQFGERAARLLLRRIDGDRSAYEEQRIETRLIVRESC